MRRRDVVYEFTWKAFKKTGNINFYLLLKELEKEEEMVKILPFVERSEEMDYPAT